MLTVSGVGAHCTLESFVCAKDSLLLSSPAIQAWQNPHTPALSVWQTGRSATHHRQRVQRGDAKGVSLVYYTCRGPGALLCSAGGVEGPPPLNARAGHRFGTLVGILCVDGVTPVSPGALLNARPDVQETHSKAHRGHVAAVLACPSSVQRCVSWFVPLPFGGIFLAFPPFHFLWGFWLIIPPFACAVW